MKIIKIISENQLKKNITLNTAEFNSENSSIQTHDTFGRKLTDVRISLIDKCNFRCSYCMPRNVFGHNYQFLSKKNLLSFHEIYLLSSALVRLGTEKIRLTGGEPLLRKDIEKLILKLKDLKTFKNKTIETALTTNGSLLLEKASSLFDAGLKRITVSLDSLDQSIFESIVDTNIKVSKILKGIDHAKKVGLGVKVNMVVKKGLNEDQILPMAEYFKNIGVTLRFIEFMDVGSSNLWSPDKVISSQNILNILREKFSIDFVGRDNPSEVSEKWRYSDGRSEFGLISSVSKPFCSDCSRARISANGFMYTCLFATSGVDLRRILRPKSEIKQSKLNNDAYVSDNLVKLISQVWSLRKDRYSELRVKNLKKTKAKKIEMSYIGG